MSNLVVTTTFSNRFSPNLLPKSSIFNDENIEVNITSGTGGISTAFEPKEDAFFSVFYTSFQTTDLSFNFGNNLQFNSTGAGNYLFQMAVKDTNSGANTFLPFDFEVLVYKNGVYSETLSGTFDFDSSVYSGKWVVFSQLIECDGSVNYLDFTFKILHNALAPTSNNSFQIGMLKVEKDDKFLGVPSAYSLPFGNLEQNNLNNLIYVESPLDLPEAVSGVRTLLDKAYLFTSNIDLNGDRLVLGENTTILGTSSELSSITSTGLGVGIPLITSIYSAPIRNIAIKDVDTAVSFDGTTNPNNMALDWTGVNFVNVPKIGTIKKASNFIFDKGSFLNSKGIKFDGTIATVAFGNSLLSGDGLAGNIIEILPTCTITRRFRTIYSSIVTTGSTIGVKVDALATIPVESYILDTVNFSGGGTYLSGVAVTDNKTLFVNCKGISNSMEMSQYYMNNNATTTTILATNTPVKVLGTTSSASITQKFTNTNNRATYIGSITRQFLVSATLSFESGTNNQIGCYIAKNGAVLSFSEVYGTTSGTGRSENVTVQTIVELSTNDYIEIYVENATAISNVLVTDLNVIVR